MLLQHSTHDPLRCSLWCESHYTALLHLKRWWLWLSWCLHNFSSSLSALESWCIEGNPLIKMPPLCVQTIPARVLRLPHPLKTKRQATFYQGASLSEYLKCTQLTHLSSSVLKPDTVSVNSVRRAILWFWLLYKMMSDTHVPFLLISNIMSCILAIAYIGQSDDYLKPCN